MSKEMPAGKDLVAEYRGNINRLIQLQLEARLDELTTLSRLQPLSADEKHEIVALTKALRTGVATQ